MINWIKSAWRRWFSNDGEPASFISELAIDFSLVEKRLALMHKIAKLRRQKKKHSHLLQELQQLTHKELSEVSNEHPERKEKA